MPSSCQRDLSPLCIKLKFLLIFGAIKNALDSVRWITINIVDCHLVKAWKATCSCAKDTDTGWNLKLRRGRELNKNAAPDKGWVNQCSFHTTVLFLFKLQGSLAQNQTPQSNRRRLGKTSQVKWLLPLPFQVISNLLLGSSNISTLFTVVQTLFLLKTLSLSDRKTWVPVWLNHLLVACVCASLLFSLNMFPVA